MVFTETTRQRGLTDTVVNNILIIVVKSHLTQFSEIRG